MISGAKKNLIVILTPSLLCHSERTHLYGSEESHCATGHSLYSVILNGHTCVEVKNLLVLLDINQYYTSMKRFFIKLRMTLILSPPRHSDERSEEESHCATGCKLIFHKHEKILRYQNDLNTFPSPSF